MWAGVMGIELVFEQRRTNVGASLLAIATYQSTLMLNVLDLSRASSLPQGDGGVFQTAIGAVIGAWCW